MTEDFSKEKKEENINNNKTVETPNKENGGEIVLDRVRTYQDAVKDALQSQSMSSAKLLMSEQRRRDERKIDEENRSLKTPKNKAFIIATVIFIVIAISIFLITLITKPKEDALSGPKNVLSSMFFEADGFIQVATAQLSRNTILKMQQVISSPFPNTSVQQIILTKEVKQESVSNVNLTKTFAYETLDMLALIEARAPDSLRRSLNRNFFLGVHSLENNEPFMIFEVTNFSNVFAGMFQWENTLVKDIEPIFFRNLSVLNKPITTTDPKLITATSTTTSTTTLELPQKTTFNTRLFEDQVIGNTDARVLKNQSGEIIFFYTFIDEKYLFFGTNIRTFTEVRKRINSARLVL